MHTIKFLPLIALVCAAVCAEAKHYSFRGGYPADVVKARQTGATTGVNRKEAKDESASAVKIIKGKVTKVSDGDTIWVQPERGEREKVRLYGIDAPESNQPWGGESRLALSNKIFGKTVTVKYVARDQYGRIVGSVFLDKVNINAAMIAEGHAWWYQYFAKEKTDWGEMERKARESKRGLWSNPTPVNPYQWRKNHY